MGAHWIDRVALALAGQPGSPESTGQADDAGPPAFTRRAGLQAAAGFAVAAAFGAERAAGASAPLSCVEKCERYADTQAGNAYRSCLDANATTAGVAGVVWFPALVLYTVGCATTNAAVATYAHVACTLNAVGRSENDCPYDRPNPPPLPRPPVTDFPPVPTDGAPGLPRRKPPRKKPPSKKPPKQPPRKPGTCGHGDLPPGATCCRSPSGDVPCATGCANDGSGCCNSADPKKCHR